MTGRWSFRSRLLFGAVAWSLGLLLLASFGLVWALEHHPTAPRAVHAVLRHPLALVVTVAFMLIGLLQVRSALTGLDRIRGRLSAIHEGRDRRLEGAFPSEVQPLVADLNTLLDERDRAVDRALATAGNLAHGLKTPLAVLSAEADRATTEHSEIALSIRQQVDRMHRQVDYHLARARAMSGQASGARCLLRDAVDGLARALLRLHASRDLVLDVQVAPDLSVRALDADIEEMVGNLLDNACRWARARVIVTAEAHTDGVHIAIDDDGPGIDESMRQRVLQRGVRADETGPGYGLGLAIVGDLAELYGGSIELGVSPMGGLRVSLRLPV